MKPCLSCGHYSDHTSTNKVTCSFYGCKCKGLVTTDNFNPAAGRLWRIQKYENYWKLYRRKKLPAVYEQVGYYSQYSEVLQALNSYLLYDPFELSKEFELSDNISID